MNRNVIIIHPDDNVAVAVREIAAGEHVEGVEGKNIKANSDIPQSHKVAIAEIEDGGTIIKYGEPVGVSKGIISPGDWVHTHNINTEEG